MGAASSTEPRSQRQGTRSQAGLVRAAGMTPTGSRLTGKAAVLQLIQAVPPPWQGSLSQVLTCRPISSQYTPRAFQGLPRCHSLLVSGDLSADTQGSPRAVSDSTACLWLQRNVLSYKKNKNKKSNQQPPQKD